jgi:hypothetical protein
MVVGAAGAWSSPVGTICNLISGIAASAAYRGSAVVTRIGHGGRLGRGRKRREPALGCGAQHRFRPGTASRRHGLGRSEIDDLPPAAVDAYPAFRDLDPGASAKGSAIGTAGRWASGIGGQVVCAVAATVIGLGRGGR